MRSIGATRSFLMSMVLLIAVLCSGVNAPASSSTSLSAQSSCIGISIFPSNSFFPQSGGFGTLFVNSPQGCNWRAVSRSPFIVIVGQAAGTVDFFVHSNSGAARSGSIEIGDFGYFQFVSITQAGFPTVPLYRYWNPTSYNHFYTTDFGEYGNGAAGYNFERIECRVFATQVPGTVPLNRYFCADNGDHFYTTSPNEPGAGLPCYEFERVECYVYPNQVSGTKPLYRYYEPNAQDHFYTTNFKELKNGALGWYLEGVQCYVLP